MDQNQCLLHVVDITDDDYNPDIIFVNHGSSQCGYSVHGTGDGYISSLEIGLQY